jgi:hypothetical protein
MAQQDESRNSPTYPTGRGYGHDYMRGGEVLGGYGYSARDEYDRTRGELSHEQQMAEGEHSERMDSGGASP